MAIPTETLQLLRERLPRGWQTLVLAELRKGGHEYSAALLTLTLKGERANVDVLNAMVLVANDYQNKLRSIQDNIAQLSENAAA